MQLITKRCPECGQDFETPTRQRRTCSTRCRDRWALRRNTANPCGRFVLKKLWYALIDRCEKPAVHGFKRYGARGTRVCERWRESFKAWLADVGPRPSKSHMLMLIDKGGHYEPGNVRWATRREIREHAITCVNLTHDGRTQCLSAWARELGMKRCTLQDRINAGWSVERALSTPVAPRTFGKSQHAI